jgi:hypothetical protein
VWCERLTGDSARRRDDDVSLRRACIRFTPRPGHGAGASISASLYRGSADFDKTKTGVVFALETALGAVADASFP